jgi:hypothetical protein
MSLSSQLIAARVTALFGLADQAVRVHTDGRRECLFGKGVTRCC